jgi:hypothetical protein
MKLYAKDNEGTSLIKRGSLMENSSLHWLNLLIKLWMTFFELNIISDTENGNIYR